VAAWQAVLAVDASAQHSGAAAAAAFAAAAPRNGEPAGPQGYKHNHSRKQPTQTTPKAPVNPSHRAFYHCGWSFIWGRDQLGSFADSTRASRLNECFLIVAPPHLLCAAPRLAFSSPWHRETAISHPQTHLS